METQVSLDEKIRSTFGKALLDALSETNRAAAKGRASSTAQNMAVKIKEKRTNVMLVTLEVRAQSSQDLEAADQVEKDFYEIVEAAALAHRGSMIKSTDATCLITFDASTDVLRAGLKIESTVARYNRDNEPMNVKIVINTDEVVSDEWGDHYKKFMNRVIQKEKMVGNGPGNGNGNGSGVGQSERVERPAEPSRISARREVSWGTSKTESGPRAVPDSTAVIPDATTRTITEKRLSHAPRTSVKVVTHKRELPEGSQHFAPHYIHGDQPRPLEDRADWSHRLFVLAVTSLVFIGGYYAIKIVGRKVSGGWAPVKEKLASSASLSSTFIQSKFFSSAKSVAPLSLSMNSVQPGPEATRSASAVPVPPAPPNNSASQPGAEPIVPAAPASKLPVPRFDTADLQMQFAGEGSNSTEKIARYRAVIRNFPTAVQALQSQIEIGKIRIALGQTELAKDIFNELLVRTPPLPYGVLAESQYQLGVAYWKEGDYASAKWCLDRVGKLYPQASVEVQNAKELLAIVRQEMTRN